MNVANHEQIPSPNEKIPSSSLAIGDGMGATCIAHHLLILTAVPALAAAVEMNRAFSLPATHERRVAGLHVPFSSSPEGLLSINLSKHLAR